VNIRIFLKFRITVDRVTVDHNYKTVGVAYRLAAKSLTCDNAQLI